MYWIEWFCFFQWQWLGRWLWRCRWFRLWRWFCPWRCRWLCLCAALALLGCTAQPESGSFSLVTYNVQTLFDDRHDGNEFSEYVPSPDGWNSRKYHNRLRRLSQVIRDVASEAPDVLVLQEIENAQVLKDLDQFFIRDLDYRHVTVSGEGSLSIAVLSKRPFLHTQVHGVRWEGIDLRPLIEVHIELPDSLRLIMYAVHWKSKRGGARESEHLRRASAHVLARAIMKNRESYPEAAFIAAGDFNEDVDEFSKSGYRTAIMPVSEMMNWQESGDMIIPIFVSSAQDFDAESADDQGISEGIPEDSEDFSVFYHLWGDEGGSYFFRDSWEKIDHILFSHEIFRRYDDVDFRVFKPWYLLDYSLEPQEYQARNANGYSDHLPVVLEFKLR